MVPYLVAGMLMAACAAWSSVGAQEVLGGSNDYFPLAVGNQWTYIVRDADGGERSVEVCVESRWGGSYGRPPYCLLLHYNGAAHWVCATPTGKIYEYPARMWYCPRASAGTSWTMDIQGAPGGRILCTDGATLEIKSRDESVSVPAGDFTAVHIQFTTGCYDGGITGEWFAPGVGLVKRIETSFLGPVTWELISARIDGREIPGTRPSSP
ncbi:MAG: hypothetical protein AB1714_23045 [Acidobacteriota bacterium]